MKKNTANMLCYVGENFYEIRVFTSSLVNTYSLVDMTMDEIGRLIADIFEMYFIRGVSFYIAIESLFVVEIPWSRSLLTNSSEYLRLLIEPVLPINTNFFDYYFWYPPPKSNTDNYLIGFDISKLTDIKMLLESHNKGIKFHYSNEIHQAIKKIGPSKDIYNIIIPSQHNFVAVGIVEKDTRFSYLQIIKYEKPLSPVNLEGFKSFLSVKFPIWLEKAAIEYKFVKPVFNIISVRSWYQKKSSYLIMLFILLSFMMAIKIINESFSINQLVDQKQMLIQETNKVLKETTISNKKDTHNLLPFFRILSQKLPNNIYIEHTSSNNLHDHVVSFSLSGKAQSFLLLDEYLINLKSTPNVISADIISSYEDESTLPKVISFEIKITMQDMEGTYE